MDLVVEYAALFLNLECGRGGDARRPLSVRGAILINANWYFGRDRGFARKYCYKLYRVQ